MARSVPIAQQQALEKRALLPRDFLTIVARDRTTGADHQTNFWSGSVGVTADVYDPSTGGISTRAWHGAGSLIEISDVTLVSNQTVPTITIKMSQLDEAVNQALRLYTVKQCPVEVFRGQLDPVTRLMVGPAVVRFVGFCDEVEIHTPEEGGEGYALLTCTSHTQEMTRSNPQRRSHEDQQLRAPGDDFLKDAAVVGEWEHFWGRKKGKLI